MDASREQVASFWGDDDLSPAAVILRAMDRVDQWAVDRTEVVEPLLVELLMDMTEDELFRAPVEAQIKIFGYMHSSRALYALAKVTAENPHHMERYLDACNAILMRDETEVDARLWRLSHIFIDRVRALSRHKIIADAFSGAALRMAAKAMRESQFEDTYSR